MMELLSLVSKYTRQKVDSDFVDRLHYKYTVLILLIVTVILGARHYVGNPIQCWVPAEFTEPMEHFAESYCWTHNTYAVPRGDPIPDSRRERLEAVIPYYQWVHFLIVVQAFGFYIPRLIWSCGSSCSGIHFGSLNQRIQACRSASSDQRRSAQSYLADYIAVSLHYPGVGGHYFLTLLYLFVKFLYFLNCVSQFLLLEYFLKNNRQKYSSFGVETLLQLTNRTGEQDSAYFPRVTMCDFKIRDSGVIRGYTVQCVLSFNMYAEKIFLFLWVWFILLALLTIMSAIGWITKLCVSPLSHHFLKTQLNHSFNARACSPENSEISHGLPFRSNTAIQIRLNQQFILSLNMDMVLLIRFVYQNEGAYNTSYLMENLYSRYVAAINRKFFEPEMVFAADINNSA